jgi:replication factor C large subunit
MLLGVADAAGGKGIHARIMPPARWQKMSTAKRQKMIRLATLNKVSAMMHLPQSTLREQYLGVFSLLVEHDPAEYAKELSFDTDQLNFFLNDKARATEIIKALAKEEKDQEKAKEPVKVSLKKGRSTLNTDSPVPDAKPVPTKETPVVNPAVLPEPTVIPGEPVSPAGEPETKKVPAKSQSTLFDGF